MKKALAFIAIALVALASQAATIQWKTGTMYNVNNADGSVGSDKAKGSVSGVYLIVDAATYDTYKDGGQKLYDDYTANKITSTRSSGNLTSNNGGQINWTDSTEVTTSSGTIYALGIFTQEYDGQTFFVANAGSAHVNELNEIEGSYSAMGGGSWTAVPEPCSVALLALGLAALGLKRKVA